MGSGLPVPSEPQELLGELHEHDEEASPERAGRDRYRANKAVIRLIEAVRSIKLQGQRQNKKARSRDPSPASARKMHAVRDLYVRAYMCIWYTYRDDRA